MSEPGATVAVITGASRGVGRGIALGLAERAGPGLVAYLTGRSLRESDSARPGSLEETVLEVTKHGAAAHAVRCDHTRDDDVRALFERVEGEQGQLDLLVNSAWGGYERMVEDGEFTWMRPFWEQPVWRFDAMFGAGVRAAYTASALAARSMVRAGSGLIVNVSFWAAQKHVGNALYGAAKAATDKLTSDMAHELRPHGVAVVSLYPGMVRTEAVMESAEFLDLSNSESPEFQGYAVAGLLRDPERMRKSGQVVLSAMLAREYGFRDTDGKLPRPLTLDDV